MPRIPHPDFLTRRKLCGAAAVTFAAAPLGLLSCSDRNAAMNEVAEKKPKVAASAEVRPFEYKASEADLADLKRRIQATRWPDAEVVKDSTQGVQFAVIQKLYYQWAN